MKVFHFIIVLWGLNTCLVFSQKNVISKDKINLVEAFEKLEKDRKIHLAYDPIQCKNYLSYTWSEEQSTASILENLLSASPFNFKPQEKNHYLIYTDQEKIRIMEKQSSSIINVHTNGQVKDKETNENLVSALVILMPDGQHTLTDNEGNFTLSKTTKYENSWIEVRYLGYQSQTFPISTIGKSLRINMIPNIAYLPTMEIKAIRPILNYNSITSNSLINGKLNSLTLSKNVFNDPVRSLQLLPGVNATEDKSVGLQIRGSNAEENLILLNGLMLFNVDHFYGVFSSINPYIVSEIQFYKSYFPTSLGGRSSSVIKFLSPVANNKVNGGIDLNLITGNAYVLSPIGKKLSLLVAGRTTTFNIGEESTLNKSLRPVKQNAVNSNDTFTISSLKPNYKFSDFYSKLDYNITPRINCSAAYFKSFDRVNTKYVSDFETRDISGFSFIDSSKWNSNGARFALDFNLNNNFNLNLAYFRSTFQFDQDIHSSILRRTNQPRNSSNNVLSLVNNDNFRISNRLQKNDSNLEYGFEYNNYNTEILFSNNLERKIILEENNKELSPYLNSNIQLNNKLHLNSGVRLSFYSLKNTPDISPRLSLNYQWNTFLSSTFNYGLYYQYLRQSRFQDQLGREYYLWIQADLKNHPILRANQIEFIQTYKRKKYTVKLELYYKELKGISEYIIAETRTSTSPDSLIILNLIGNGRYYGLDASFEQKLKNYSIQFIYSYNKSENSFERIFKGEYFQKPYVRNHQVKCIQNVSIKDFVVSLTGIYGSSLPNLISRIPSGNIMRESNNYLDDFLRFDIDLRYTLKLNKRRMELYFSVLNLTDRVNLKYVQNLVRVPINNSTQNSSTYTASAEVENLRRTINLGIGYHF